MKQRNHGGTILEGIFNTEFCVWGTGKYGRMFLNKLSDYSNICKKVFGINAFDNIKYFIDSDIEKQKKELCNKLIKSPGDFYHDNVELCVIATVRVKEIESELKKNGNKNNFHYVTWGQMIEKYKKGILEKRSEILKKFNFTSFDESETLDFYKITLILKKELENLIEGESKTDTILKYVVFSILIDYWQKSLDKKRDFLILRDCFEDSFIIAAFAWYYGDDITKIAEWFSKNINDRIICTNNKQTIGLVVDRYFGGGIEKVVSLLLPLYVRNGHKVVLITDSYESEMEYDIPREVIRHTMSYKTEDNVQQRLDELSTCVRENHIDIMCFHFGYTRISTFYEMLRLKLQNIAVLMEVHSAFLTLITEHKDIAKSFAYMYMMADRLIVLSNVDKLFWESLGCNCTYIQNPVEENGEKSFGKNIRNENSPIIVWVGRLVQTPKRIFDTIPIMKEVVKKIPYAKLRIVGVADEQWVYQSLIKQIEKNNLENNVELCGYKSNADEVYCESDIVLITSSSESFSNVIMESKIRGIPIVMYELPWLELLKNGKGYISVKQGDVEAAAEAIVKLLCENELRERMSIESRESIEPFIKHDVYLEWKKVFDGISVGKNKETTVCSDYVIIEKLLLNAVCECL